METFGLFAHDETDGTIDTGVIAEACGLDGGLAAGTEGVFLEVLDQRVEQDIACAGHAAADEEHFGVGGGGDAGQRHAQRVGHILDLAGGQRIAIAGVIAMKPEIIVFDESTSMLDPAGRLEVMETAKALNRENGVTVVWITHFMDEAAQASRLIVVDDGEIRLDGAPRQVFSRVKEIQSYGLEAPDMTVLAAMLRERGLNVSGEILTVEEMEVELCRLRSSI